MFPEAHGTQETADGRISSKLQPEPVPAEPVPDSSRKRIVPVLSLSPESDFGSNVRV
jgi:hypothetical protein